MKSILKKILVPFLGLGLLASTAFGSNFPLGKIKTAEATPTPIFNQHSNDEPTIQVRKVGETAWSNSVNLKEGETAQFFLYVHNNVEGSVATNTKVKATVPTTSAKQHTVGASVSADNATTVNGDVTVNLPEMGDLKVNPSSVKHYINQNGQYAEQPISGTDKLFTPEGLNLGNINGCWQYLRAITFTASYAPHGEAQITTYKEVSISNVDNAWHRDGVTTTPGNVAAFHIFLENTGQKGSVLEKPTITDTLAPELTYKPNSSYMITRNLAGEDVRYDIPDSYIAFSGKTITWAFSDMPANPGRSIRLYFQATLADGTAFPIGTTRVLNKATAKGVTNGKNLSTDTNNVFIDVVKAPTAVVNFDVEKTVRNITTGSLLQDDVAVPGSPGDTIEYNLRIVNTGNTAAEVIIKDTLPTNVTVEGDVLGKKASEPISAYRPMLGDSGPKLLSTGWNLGVVQPGNTNGFDFRFTVKINTEGFTAGTTSTLTNRVDALKTSGSIYDTDYAYVTVGATSGYTLSKWVKDPRTNDWAETTETRVKEGDIIRYRIDIVNNGNTQLKINSIRDVLPQYTRYVDNSLVLDPHISPTPVSNDDNFFNGTGIGNFSIYPGVTKRFEFDVKVVECPILGLRDLVNTAYLRANDSTTEVNDAAIIKLEVKAPGGNL